MMKPAAAVLLFLLLVLTAHAADKIEGAFGLTLGQEFHAEGQPVDKLGYTGAIECKPPAPNPAFDIYLVFLTPRTHRIYRIVGVATLSDEAAATKLLTSVGAFVQHKYDGIVNGNQLPTFQCVVKQGELASAMRTVTVSAGASQSPLAPPSLGQDRPPEGKRRCDVSYEDWEVARQVLSEQQLNTIEGFDGKGL